MRAVVAERDKLGRSPAPPVLLKLGPDGNLASRAHLAHVAMAAGVDGIVISNTSAPTNEGLPRGSLVSEHRTETGGLSGAPLRNRALQVCAEMYVLTEVGANQKSFSSSHTEPSVVINLQSYMLSALYG